MTDRHHTIRDGETILLPDADLANADWAKRTWDVDLPQTAGEIDQLTEAMLRTLAALPVWAAAPDEVREAAEARLSQLDD